MKNKLFKKLALCSLVSLGIVAIGVSLISCGTSNDLISFSINDVTNTTFTKGVGSTFTIDATYNNEEETAVEGEESWSWEVDSSTGLILSGADTSSLTVTAQVEATYVFTATYYVDGTSTASSEVTVNVVEADVTYRLYIDEDSSTLTYNQGSTFRKEYIDVYRLGIQLDEVAFSVKTTDYDIKATLNGTTYTLTDGYQLTEIGTYSVLVEVDGFTANTTLSVLEDLAWQITSTLGTNLSENNYYVDGGVTLSVGDDVIYNHTTNTAYAVSSGSPAYDAYSNYSITAVRKFKVTEEDENGNPKDASVSDFVYAPLLGDSTTDYTSSSIGGFTSLTGFATINGLSLGSDWTNTLAAGMTTGTLYITDENQQTTVVSGYYGGQDLNEYFFALSGYTQYLSSYYANDYCLIVPEDDSFLNFTIYITMYYGSSSYVLDFTLSLGSVDNSVVATLANSTSSSTMASEETYTDETLRKGLALSKYGADYSYWHEYMPLYTFSGSTGYVSGYTYDEVYINDDYYYLKDATVSYNSSYYPVSVASTSISGYVVTNTSDSIYDGDLYKFEISDDTLSVDTTETTTLPSSVNYNILGNYVGLQDEDDELLWLHYDTIEYINGYTEYYYRSYGTYLPFFLIGYASENGTASDYYFYYLYTSYIEYIVVLDSDRNVYETSICLYFVISGYYDYPTYFYDYIWYIREDIQDEEESSVYLIQNYVDNLNSNSQGLSLSQSAYTTPDTVDTLDKTFDEDPSSVVHLKVE